MDDTEEPVAARKSKRGRKPGLLRGSRAWSLSRMKPGDRLSWPVPPGVTPQSYMGQVSADVGRANKRGLVSLSAVVGIELATRSVVEFVLATHKQ